MFQSAQSPSNGSKPKRDFDERCAEFKRIHEKYPDRVPVICWKNPNSDSPELEKKQFLVSHAMLWKEFKKMLAKHMKDGSSAVPPSRWLLKVTVNNAQPTSNTSMLTVYESHKSSDGFLYATVEGCAEESDSEVMKKLSQIRSKPESSSASGVTEKKRNDGGQDRQNLLTTIEDLGKRVAALEMCEKKVTAETRQYGERVAVVEGAMMEVIEVSASGPHSGVDQPEVVDLPRKPEVKDHEDQFRHDVEPTGSQQMQASTHPLASQLMGKLLPGWIQVKAPVVHTLVVLAVLFFLSRLCASRNSPNITNQDKLVVIEQLKSRLEEETQKSEHLSQVMQKQLIAIQQLTAQVQLAQEAPRPWWTDYVFLPILFSMIFLTQKENLSAVLKRYAGTEQQQEQRQGQGKVSEKEQEKERERNREQKQEQGKETEQEQEQEEQEHQQEQMQEKKQEPLQEQEEQEQEQEQKDEQEQQQEQEQEQEILATEIASQDSPPCVISTFTYTEMTTQSEQGIDHRIDIQCPPGILHEHVEGEIFDHHVRHGFRIKINKPGDKDLPALNWEKDFFFSCKEGWTTFDFKEDEAKLENDILSLIFRATPGTRKIWKLTTPGRETDALLGWKFLGGDEAPLGLCPLPETSETNSGFSGPACLQKTAMQYLDASISERAETDPDVNEHIPDETVQGLRRKCEMFAQRYEDSEMSDASQAEILPSATAQSMPLEFDISSEAGQAEIIACPMEASQVQSEVFQSMVKDLPESREPLVEELPIQDLRGAFAGPFRRLVNQAPSECASSCKDWEKPELIMEEMEPSD